jgi:hypothetical protein
VVSNNAWSSIFWVSTFLDISYEFVHLAATTYNKNSLATLSRRLFDYIGEYSDYSEVDWDSDSDTEEPVV